MEPLLPPLQLTSTFVTDGLNAAGCVTVALEVAVQPLASVTVTVYVPADKEARSSVVAPFDQLKVYAVVPPPTVKLIVPLFPPLQVTFVFVLDAVNTAGCVIVAPVVAVHP